MSREMLTWMKNAAIAAGMEPWARPLWTWMTGAEPDRNDAAARRFMEAMLSPAAVCVDAGCHKGLILDMMIAACPRGRFFGFEPIPALCSILRRKYRGNSAVEIHQLALWDAAGTAQFHIDLDSPGLSSIEDPGAASHRRKVIEVETAALDDVLVELRPDFLKIDVEGAELHVLRGARRILARDRPFVFFEHGREASDRFGTTPDQIYDLLAECGLRISLTDDFLAGRRPLDRDSFRHLRNAELSLYFLAHR